MVPNPARRVYSSEELHRLRDSKSQPKLCEAIEEHDANDAELVKGMFATRVAGHHTAPLCRCHPNPDALSLYR